VWSRTLADAGIGVLAVDADHVRLTTEAGPLELYLRSYSAVVAPSQIPKPPSRHSLLHVPRISPKSMDVMEARGWSVVTDDGHVSLLLEDGTRLRRHPLSNRDEVRRRSPGPPQYGRFAVIRALLEASPWTQVRLAGRAGLTQPRVSRILTSLHAPGLIIRTERGWQPADWDQLCDWFLAHYQGPGGVRTYWYSLEPTVSAAMAASQAAYAQGVRAGLSGDAAADLVLPWRRPQDAVVYAERGVDLARYGFTSALSEQDATLTLIVPKDHGVWPPIAWRPSAERPEVELVDPVQVLYDLHGAAGADAHQAAERWRNALQARSVVSTARRVWGKEEPSPCLKG
jgi:hypothetical protein